MSENANKKDKLSFIERVMAKLSGGDESKIGRFQKRLVKELDDQVSIRTKSIEDNNDKISDIEEEMSDSLLELNLEKIKTTESTKSYVKDFIKVQVGFETKIAELKEDTRVKNLEIELMKKIKEKIS